MLGRAAPRVLASALLLVGILLVRACCQRLLRLWKALVVGFLANQLMRVAWHVVSRRCFSFLHRQQQLLLLLLLSLLHAITPAGLPPQQHLCKACKAQHALPALQPLPRLATNYTTPAMKSSAAIISMTAPTVTTWKSLKAFAYKPRICECIAATLRRSRGISACALLFQQKKSR